MEENKITINAKVVERTIKKERFKRKVKESFQKTVYWINDNKEFLMIAIPAVVAVTKCGSKVIGSIARNIALNKEQKMKDLYIYDRSLGRYIELRRPLRNQDMKIILDRRENGERLSNILMDMNLMK